MSGEGHLPFARSADLDYFRRLERAFIELRGAPLQLSPDDYRVAKAWRTDGVPLDVALETVREVVERAVAAEKEIKRRLRYYDRAVRAAWQRRAELAAPGAMPEEPAFDAAGRLGRLAGCLPKGLAAIESAVRDLASEALDPEQIEGRLASLDQALVDAARSGLEAGEAREIDAAVDAAVDDLRPRLGNEAAEAARDGLAQQILRRRLSLPVLSLFAPEAVSDPSDAPAADR
ncbi:MAG: hypothetical protein AAGC60_02665 [Acidobacteriota bacterium]